MNQRRYSLIVGTAFTVALAGCGGGGGTPPTGGSSSTSNTPTPIVVNHVLPTGDTFNKVGTSWDITNVKTTVFGDDNQINTMNYDSLRVDVTFAENIQNALPLPGSTVNSPTQLVLGIAVDPSPSASDFTMPFNCVTQNAPLNGFESAGAQRLGDGNFPIINVSGIAVNQLNNPTTEAQTTVSANTISEIFRLGTIGATETTTAPQLGVSVVAENGANTVSLIRTGFELSDCAPRGTSEYDTLP